MANFEEARVKLTNTQLNKLRFAAKNKIGTTLRITRENFLDEELPHELFLTRQKTKIKNAFANNISNDLKLGKAQLSKIIQLAGFLGALFGKLAGPLMKVAFALAKNVLAPLATLASASTIHAAI